jgi:predicted PurR-regulated permease PerM
MIKDQKLKANLIPVWRKFITWLLIISAMIIFLMLFREVLLPFVVGLAVAYFLDPCADWLEDRKVPRWAAATLVLVAFAMTFLMLVVLALPLLQTQFSAAAEAMPRYAEKIEQGLDGLLLFVSEHLHEEDAQRVREAVGAQVGKGVEVFGSLIQSIFKSGLALVNFSTFLFVTPVVAFYLLRDWDRLIGWLDSLVPRRIVPTVRQQAKLIDETLAGFVRGQASVCALLGLFYGIGLTAVGLQFGFVVGVLAGILAFIPYVGSIFGLFVSVGLAFIQFDGHWDIIAVAAVFIVGQLLEGNVLTPKLVGGRIGLHPVWVIFSLFAGGALLGFLGMLLALPIAAAVGVLLRFAVAEYRKSQIYLGDDDPQNDTGDPA